jgi:hypothetical protein
VQAKGICNIVNKIITEHFLSLLEGFAHSGTGNLKDLSKIEPLHGILSFKQQHREQRKNIEDCKRR